MITAFRIDVRPNRFRERLEDISAYLPLDYRILSWVLIAINSLLERDVETDIRKYLSQGDLENLTIYDEYNEYHISIEQRFWRAPSNMSASFRRMARAFIVNNSMLDNFINVACEYGGGDFDEMMSQIKKRSSSVPGVDGDMNFFVATQAEAAAILLDVYNNHFCSEARIRLLSVA